MSAGFELIQQVGSTMWDCLVPSCPSFKLPRWPQWIACLGPCIGSLRRLGIAGELKQELRWVCLLRSLLASLGESGRGAQRLPNPWLWSVWFEVDFCLKWVPCALCQASWAKQDSQSSSSHQSCQLNVWPERLSSSWQRSMWSDAHLNQHLG